MDRTTQTKKSVGNDAESGEPGKSLGPTDAEVEAWAERVRLRRQSWVDGPTEDEKQEWQRRERVRRAARVDSGPESDHDDAKRRDPYEERLRLQRRYIREARLLTEGVGAWLATLPFRVLADFVTAGREWEEESLRPARRRWIPFSDDDV
jgi:hypothetical protein